MNHAQRSAMPESVQEAGVPFFSINNLVKEFNGVRAVDDISLTIQQGEIFALLGSSGCGKSTLLRMLAGFDLPTSGSILFNDKDISDAPPHQRPFNMMFQSYALFPHLNVWDNIAFGLRRDGLPKHEIEKQVKHMLSLVQLENFGERKPYQLSGGQQQRVALARSLAKRPQLLLLDEPLGALDKKLREQTQLELVNILEQVGVTCVMVTHDQEEAMTMASRIAIMSEGRIVQVGKPGDLYETPNCRFVADFIGTINLFDGVIMEDEADHIIVRTPECTHFVNHGINGTMDQQVSVGVRPEKLQVDFEAPPDPAPKHNYVVGVLDDWAYMGSYTTYHIRLETGMVLKASMPNRDRARDHQPVFNEVVHVQWSSDNIVVLDR